jgi:hypothetical protein
MNRKRLGLALVALMAVVVLAASESIAESHANKGMMTARNALCTGGAGGTAACQANFILVGNCIMNPDPCGVGIPPAVWCECMIRPFGAPPGCFCEAS